MKENISGEAKRKRRRDEQVRKRKDESCKDEGE